MFRRQNPVLKGLLVGAAITAITRRKQAPIYARYASALELNPIQSARGASVQGSPVFQVQYSK